jgi:peroxiredoxin
MRSDDLYSLPANLPVPIDDGACDHLPGLEVPPVDLPATDGRVVRLGAAGTVTGGTTYLGAGRAMHQSAAPTRWTVVYAYPRTGVPDKDSPAGWDEIPGARGCTPQNCAYRDHHAELTRLGASVYGLSTQSTEYQREMAERLHLPYSILSDERLELTNALRLPTFRHGEWTLIKRLCLILEGARIVHLIYPVFPSTADAPAVTAWLRARVR